MEKVVQSKKPREYKNLSVSVNLGCSKCDKTVSKDSLYCKHCDIQHKNFDEEKN